MTYYVVKQDGKALFQYSDPQRCVAEMLVRGMISDLDIQRFGCVWKQGVELIKVENANARAPERVESGGGV